MSRSSAKPVTRQSSGNLSDLAIITKTRITAMGNDEINNDSESKYNSLDLAEISKYNFYRVLF